MLIQHSSWNLRRHPLFPALALLAVAGMSLAPAHAEAAGAVTRLLRGLRLDAATSAQTAHLSLTGAPVGPTFEWIVTNLDGSPANTKPGTPATTSDPFLHNLFFSSGGNYNAQVLFTAPGERVVGSATSLAIGAPLPGPTPVARMSAAFVLPEVGDEVLFDLRQTEVGATPVFTINFGDGTTSTFLTGRTQHVYDEAGWYRVTATATGAGGASASVYLDLVVVEPTAMVDDEMLKFAACMVDLRATSGDWSCRDRTNPLNDALKLATGTAPNTNGCIPAPTMVADGWRCLTPQALRRCRAYANGHRHLPSYPIRHCQIEGQPETLEFPQHGEFEATLDESAHLGVDLATTTDAVLRVTPLNPGEPSVPGSCDPVVAAHFGKTCDTECSQSYYTFGMPPSGPHIPVIAGSPCGATFEIPLDDGWATVGDLHEQIAATCPVLVPAAGDPPVAYETSIWTDVTAHFIWHIPRTEEWFDGNVWQREYWNEPYDVAVETLSISAPVTVNCRR